MITSMTSFYQLLLAFILLTQIHYHFYLEISSQITRHEPSMESVEWVKFYTKKNDHYVLDTIEYTVLHDDICQCLKPPDILWAEGSRFVYSFELDKHT